MLRKVACMVFRLEGGDPVSSSKALLKGLIAGSLMVSALLNDYWIGWRFFLFAGGLLVFMEGLFPYDKELHTGALVTATIAGGLVSLALTVYGGVVSYTVLMMLIGAALYCYWYAKNRTKTWF